MSVFSNSRANIRFFVNSFALVVMIGMFVSHPFQSKAGETKQLRYNLLPGETFSFSSSTEIKNIISEMQFTMGSVVSTNIKTNVQSIDDAKTTLGVSYSDTKVTTSGMAMAGIPDGTTNYDDFSNNNETLVLSDRGATLSRVLKNTKKGGKLSPIERNAQSAVKALSYLITEFPEKPLKVGDSWVISRKDTAGSKSENQIISTMVMQYTLANYIDTLGVSCAHLKCRSMSSTTSGTIEMMGRSMNFEGDGSLIGNVYVELATGMTLVSTIDNQIDMRISMGGQDGMIMPITVDTHSSVKRIVQSNEQK
ncbi:MAG: hypothetical protein JST20_14230 [Bacteroidetes bacterium]|nr:hypothetical protein [Bacteroidota bacterium]